MSLFNTQRAGSNRSLAWQSVCNEHDLVNNSGVVVWHDGVQVALFYLPSVEGQTLYAIDNHDPKSGANEIGRGLVGSTKGGLVVAAPLYKQHSRLEDGCCLEDPQQQLRVWPVRLNEGVVEIGVA